MLRHLELLGEIVRRGEIIAFHGIVKQCAQCTGTKWGEFAESIESGACIRALFRLGGVDLKCRKIELVKIVARLFFYRGRELLFLLCEISFRTCQPASDDMEGSRITIGRGDIVQRFSRNIELAKAQCPRGKIELTGCVVRKQSRDLCAPGDGFLKVLLFRRLRQNLKGRQRIRMQLQNLARVLRCLGKFLFLQHRSCPMQQTRFVPAPVEF